MLTHANLLSVVAGQLGAINQVGGRYGQTFTQEDVMISYLPLAHIFDRCAVAFACERVAVDADTATVGLHVADGSRRCLCADCKVQIA